MEIEERALSANVHRQISPIVCNIIGNELKAYSALVRAHIDGLSVPLSVAVEAYDVPWQGSSVNNTSRILKVLLPKYTY